MLHKETKFNIELSDELFASISNSEFKDITKYLENSPLSLEGSFYASENSKGEFFKKRINLNVNSSECENIMSEYINKLFSETKSSISGKFWVTFILYLIEYINAYGYPDAISNFAKIVEIFISELFNSIFKEFSFQDRFLSYKEYKTFEYHIKKNGSTTMFKSKETLLGFASILDLSYEDILKIVQTGIHMIDTDLLQCYYYRYIFTNKDEVLTALGKDESVKLLVSLRTNRDLDHIFPLVGFWQTITEPSKYDEIYFINDTVAGIRFLNINSIVNNQKEKDYIKKLFNNIDFLRKLRYLIFEGETYEVSIGSQILKIFYRLKIKQEDFNTEENLKLVKQIISRIFIGKADIYKYKFISRESNDDSIQFALDYLYANDFIIKTNNEIEEFINSDLASPKVYIDYKHILNYCFNWEDSND